MNTLDLARTAKVSGPEPLTTLGQESHNAVAIHVAFPPDETVPLTIQKRKGQSIPECCWSDWQNPLNDF